jgi:hypothetical protein
MFWEVLLEASAADDLYCLHLVRQEVLIARLGL